MPISSIIDLDAARREAGVPEGITVRHTGQDWTLPAELPVSVFDPLLSDDLDLIGLIKDFMEDPAAGEDEDEVFTQRILARANLPKAVIDAVHGVMIELFGPEQWQQFLNTRPALLDLVRLLRALLPMYGVGLGEAFRSLISSDDGGATSKPTSPSVESTPVSLSARPEPKTFSESVASAT